MVKMFRAILFLLINVAFFMGLIVFLPGSVLLDIKPKSHQVRLPRHFVGGLRPDNILEDSAVKLYVDRLDGPESIATYKGRIFTGTNDGFINEIIGDQTKRLLKISEDSCVNDKYDMTRCGRPLGIKVTSKGILYAVYAHHGVYSADLNSNNPKLKLIFDIQKTAQLGKTSLFFDDVAVDEEAGLNSGDVLYVSDVSSKFPLEECLYSYAGSDVGRILKYDVGSDHLETVVSNVYFPNGVELTDDRSALLFCELTTKKVYKYNIRGQNATQTELFIPYLPGEPDNIRRSANKQETYWIALSAARNQTSATTLDWMLTRPFLRKLVLRLMHLIGTGLEWVGTYLKNPALDEMGIVLKHGYFIMMGLEKSYGMAVEVNKNGKIINSLHSPKGTFTLLSEAKEIRLNEKETVVYLGSFINKYLAKVILNR